MNLRQRKFFAHAAHGSVGVVPNRVELPDGLAWDAAMPDLSTDLLRVCVVATPVGDDADCALDALLEAVSRRLPLAATRAWRSADDASPDFAELHQCDVALICGRRMPLAGEALARVQWYCGRGRPLLALGAGGGPTFARWPRFDVDVLGIEAGGSLTADIRPWHVEAIAGHHPILADAALEAFSGSFPERICLAEDAEVLLRGGGTGAPQPLAWTRSRGTARLFATALGQLEHLTAPGLIALVSNALRWVMYSSRSA